MRDRIKKIVAMPGNYCSNGIYISLDNMNIFSTMFSGKNIILEDLLITPFLINTNSGKMYELHYYEFEINISSVGAVGYKEYHKENKLPKEIIDNLKPSVVVSKNSISEFTKALKMYLDAMKTMKFEDDTNTYPELKDSKLFFQLY